MLIIIILLLMAINNIRRFDFNYKFYFYIILAIEMEKKSNFIAGIEKFDPAVLKHTETCEKNPLPTKEAIEEEKRA